MTRDEIVMEFVRAYCAHEDLRHALASSWRSNPTSGIDADDFVIKTMFDFADKVIAERDRRTPSSMREP